MTTQLAVIILAAGKGTRMNNTEKAKVMFEILGIPMIGRVVEMALKLNPQKVIVVVGYQREMVEEYLSQFNHQLETVIQDPQLGTGQATSLTETELINFNGNILVLAGDVPLLLSSSILQLINYHEQNKSAATILTANLDNPFGYGRIIRDQNGNVNSIVEEKDGTEEEKKINEINSGIYIFQKDKLFDALKKIKPHNSQKELYLTDVIAIFKNQNLQVSAIQVKDSMEILGINTVDQLIYVEKLLIEKNEKSS